MNTPNVLHARSFMKATVCFCALFFTFSCADVNVKSDDTAEKSWGDSWGGDDSYGSYGGSDEYYGGSDSYYNGSDDSYYGGSNGNYGGSDGYYGGSDGYYGGSDDNYYGGSDDNYYGGSDGYYGGSDGYYGGSDGNYGGSDGNYGGSGGNYGGSDGNYGGSDGNYGGSDGNYYGSQQNGSNGSYGQYNAAVGQRLANTARQMASQYGSTGRCYSAVADAIDAVIGRFLYGASAYMAADQLAGHPSFVEISSSNLASLPAGAVVVWARGTTAHGHISISLGDGNEASDHIAPQMTSHYGGGSARVFLPR